MNVFHFHPVTGLYLGSSIADHDPMELQLARAAAAEPIAEAARAAHAEAVRFAEAGANATYREAVAAASEEAQAAFEAAVAEALEGEEGDEARAAARNARLIAVSAAAGEAEIARQASIAAATTAADQELKAAQARAQQAADAVEPEHWLIPAHATAEEPPAPGEGEQVVRREDAWEIEQIPTPPAPEPPPTIDLAQAARDERDQRIASVRPLIDRHRDQVDLGLPTTLTPAEYLAALQHIQALRDVPQQPGFPADIAWPALPADILNPTETIQ